MKTVGSQKYYTPFLLHIVNIIYETNANQELKLLTSLVSYHIKVKTEYPEQYEIAYITQFPFASNYHFETGLFPISCKHLVSIVKYIYVHQCLHITTCFKPISF